MKSILIFLMLVINTAWAKPYRLFEIHKSHNPENLLIFETDLDDQCRFVSGDDGLVHFYWLMGGKKFKPLNMLIQMRLKQSLQISDLSQIRDNFELYFKGKTDIKHDIKNLGLHIRSEIDGDQCQVKSILMLGPRHNYHSIDLKEIFCKTSLNFFGIPNGCKYIIFTGSDIATGEIIKARFDR